MKIWIKPRWLWTENQKLGAQDKNTTVHWKSESILLPDILFQWDLPVSTLQVQAEAVPCLT